MERMILPRKKVTILAQKMRNTEAASDDLTKLLLPAKCLFRDISIENAAFNDLSDSEFLFQKLLIWRAIRAQKPSNSIAIFHCQILSQVTMSQDWTVRRKTLWNMADGY